jgi:gliding motility-associated-like protein
MIWRLLLAVFLVASSVIHTFGQNFLPIGVTSSPVAGNTIYGYCFQATTNFTICGLKVKYDNNSTPTNQRLFVVKFSTTPANFSVTPPLTPSTQIFPFLVTSPTAAQLCNITVNSGEYIGIYGYRESACRNYFSTLSSGTLTVNGFNMALTRSGGVLTNGTCGTTPSFNGFFSEPGLPLGAVELYTNCCFTPTIGTISQPNCTSTTGSIILNGLPPGNWTLNSYLNGNITTPASTITGSGNSYTVSGLSAGSYIFSVTNSGGCTSANTSSTTINPSIFIPTASITNNTGNTVLTCAQNSISLSAAGSGTYAWTNGSTNVGSSTNISASAPGTYTLTVTATNGCTATANITLTQNIGTPGASISSPYNQLNCSLNSITLTATGSGTYNWANGATNLGTNASISVSAPGTYQLTVTGTNGCTSTANYVVTQFSGTTVTVNSSTICSGQNTTLTATPVLTGGTYSWSPGGATTSSITINPNTTTTYTVNYTVSGCTSTGTGTVTVNPTPLVTVNNSTICPGVNTTLTASGSPSGGTYTWAPSGITGTTLTVNPSSTTNYTVTYNLNGCTPGSATSTVTVQNSLDFVNVQSPGSVSICQGQTLTIYGQVYEAGLTNPAGQAAGITVEFAYGSSNTDPSSWPSSSWNLATYNPLSLLNPNNDEYMGVIPVLSPGTYYFAFRYTYNGCVSYGGYSSTGGGFWNGSTNNNGILIVNPNSTPTFNSVSAICAGSALNALPTISTNLISGSWSPALSNQQTTSYTFTPSAGICATTSSLTITVNPLPTAAITAPSTTILTCSNTSITLTATGGGSYLWSTGSTTSSITVNTPGTFPVTVTGANGCTSTASQTITQNTTPPSAAITPPITNVLTCTTTSITLTATGGGTYSWSNGAAVVGTNATLSVTSPGTYTVTVTGANGCTASASQIITQSTAPPTVAITPPTTTVLTCASTSISLTATGGGTYSWSNGTAVVGTNATLAVTTPGTYTVTVTSANGCTANASQVITQNISTPVAGITAPTTSVLTCATTSISLIATGGGTYSWSNGTAVVGTNATLSVNTQGTYTVTVTSANGCTATAAQIITQSTALPTAAITAPTTSVLTCATTSISLTATGGGTYSWSNGTAVVGTNATLSVNTPATYTVTVTGANGCTATAAQIITQSTALPTAAITAPTTTVLTCTTTSISLTATGGGTYSWSNGTAVVGTNATLAVTTPGSYTVTVTSPNGCTATAAQVITQNITNPTAAINAPTTTVLTCTTTSISLTATGGGNYSWSNGTAVLGTNATLAVTTPGTYTVTVTSPNGCTATAVQVVTQSTTLPSAAISTPATTVLTCTTTSITLTATGGGTYSWSNGTVVLGTNATLNVTSAGTYTVTVTSPNGCTATAAQVITQNILNPTPTANALVTSVLTCNETFTSIIASGGGTYSWSNGTAVLGTNPVLYVTNPGTYTVTVTSPNGCTATATQIITQNTTVPSVGINATPSSVLSCTNTSITLTASGGSMYSWSNGTAVVGTNATLNVTTPGTYTVTVTGTNGCTGTLAQTITQNTTPPTAGINTPTTTILTCSTTSIPLSATGGGTYSWYSGATNIGNSSTLTVTNPGFYTLIVTAPNGCDSQTNIVITQDVNTPVASITNNTNSTILDCNTTQISLTGNGGTNASWSNGTTNVSNTAALTVTTAGTYTYTGTNTNGCFDTDSITVTFTPNTNPTFTQIAAICTNETFTLPTTSSNGIQGAWSPAPNYTTTTTYTFQPNAGLCANTTTMTVTVHPYPVVTIQNDTICVGQSASITANVNFAGGLYTWSPVVSTANSITVTPNVTTSYQVIYSLLGCADTSIAEILVNPIPTVTLNNYTICNGQSATIQPTINLTGGSYIWSNGSTLDSLVITPNTSSNYSLSYTLNGCTSPIASSSVTVNPVPTLGINNSTICFGDNTTITAVPNLPGGIFYWGTPGVSGAASQTISPQNDTTLSVYYTLNGCSSPIVTSSVNVNPLPIATFSSNVTQGCVPLQVNFVPDDATNTDYTWTTSNSLSSTSISPNLNFQTSGSFDITLTTSLNGCVVTETLTNYIQVDDYPIADFAASVTIFSEQNQLVQFENNSIGATTYLWEFGDGETSTDDTPSHIYLNTEDGTTIVLTAISLHGCTDTSIIEIPFDPGLIFYIPNSFTPDGDMNNQTFNPVISSGVDIYNYTMLIYNRWGEVIFESNDTNYGWDGSYGPTGIHCQSGSYTYEIIVKLPNIDQRKKYTGIVNLIR